MTRGNKHTAVKFNALLLDMEGLDIKATTSEEGSPSQLLAVLTDVGHHAVSVGLAYQNAAEMSRTWRLSQEFVSTSHFTRDSHTWDGMETHGAWRASPSQRWSWIPLKLWNLPVLPR